MCEVNFFMCCFPGVEGLVVQGDQAISQMNHLGNLERYHPDSAEVEFDPLHNRQSSFPEEDNMVCILK